MSQNNGVTGKRRPLRGRLFPFAKPCGTLLRMVQVEVTKTGTENVLSTIRKFTRRVQGTGLIKSIRKNRYYSRDTSKSVQKKSALKRIKRRDEFQQLLKEGKVVEQVRRGGRPGSPAQTQPRTEQQAAPARLGEGTPIAR